MFLFNMVLQLGICGEANVHGAPVGIESARDDAF